MSDRGLVLLTAELSTPIGDLLLIENDRVLCALTVGRERWDETRAEIARAFGGPSTVEFVEERPERLASSAAVRDYFAGDLRAIDRVKVGARGTPFQKSVWDELRRIPVGTTISYADLARAVGRPSAVRAVGGANGRNPVAIVVPCHRVIGSDGTLTGYGGGLPRKEWLLAHEGATLV